MNPHSINTINKYYEYYLIQFWVKFTISVIISEKCKHVKINFSYIIW